MGAHKKDLPVLTFFSSKDGKEWVAWTTEEHYTASSLSALGLAIYVVKANARGPCSTCLTGGLKKQHPHHFP